MLVARFSFQLSTFNFNLYLGGYSAEVPPLPIPNRVVKLSIADGTALRCGRVGSRHFESLDIVRYRGSLFIALRACYRVYLLNQKRGGTTDLQKLLRDAGVTTAPNSRLIV